MEEHSAGIIVFRNNKRREYLVLHYGAGHWDFAKGKIEKNESPEEAALRELNEETGIENIEMLEFREKVRYVFQRGKRKVFKEVEFFLGKTNSSKVILSDEHTEFKWLAFEKAIDQLTFDNAKELLKKADLRAGELKKG